MKKSSFPIIILLLAATFSCSKAPLSNGPMTTETRIIEDFTRIEQYNNVYVHLVKSDSSYIEISACANLMDNIITKVSGGTLTIKNENSMNWLRSYDNRITATVHYTDFIDDVYYESVGDLICDDTIHHNMNIFIYDGSGDIDIKTECKNINIHYRAMTSNISISGECNKADVIVEGLGPFHAENLIVHNNLNINMKGQNDAFVNCIGHLNVIIDHIGNVRYVKYSDEVPTISLTKTPKARGELIPIEI